MLVEDPVGDGDVIGEGLGRVLHDVDLMAGFAEAAVDGLPAGAVDESAVDEDNVARDDLL